VSRGNKKIKSKIIFKKSLDNLIKIVYNVVTNEREENLK
jgi:hypothetical protein